MFDNIYKLDGVPVATVQLRFDGWVTELNDLEKMKDVKTDYSGGRAPGMDNLLYTADAEFSCFADLALVSPSSNYYKEGEASFFCVFASPAGGNPNIGIQGKDLEVLPLFPFHLCLFVVVISVV